LVGYEYDRYMSNYSAPTSRSRTLLSKSPLVNAAGQSDYANSSLYQAPSGAWVFAAGTVSWGWGLDNYRAHNVVDPRIQRTTANLLDRFADDVRPVVKAPAQSFAVPTTLDTTLIPVKLQWSAMDATSGVVRYQLQQSTTGGTYAGISLPSATTTSISRSLTPGATYRFRVRALDGAENWSGWAYGPSFVVDAPQETSTAIAYTGTWTRHALSGAYGGYVKDANVAGARATFSFTGRNVAWVTTGASDRGKAEVWLDGVKVSTIDLYSSSAQVRRIVFARAFSSSGDHTLEVRPLGTRNTASTGTRVDLDAMTVLR
jgi:hypothetical protein